MNVFLHVDINTGTELWRREAIKKKFCLTASLPITGYVI